MAFRCFRVVLSVAGIVLKVMVMLGLALVLAVVAVATGEPTTRPREE